MGVGSYLQALNNLISHSLLIYEELKYEKECEKKEDESFESGEDSDKRSNHR